MFGGMQRFDTRQGNAQQRFKLISAVHLILLSDGMVLLQRRSNTGYEDGNYSVIAGHLDGNETVTDAVVREAMEEAAIIVARDKLRLVHVMHRKATDERVDFFFVATEWNGEPRIAEPLKCSELRWFRPDDLPSNLISYVRSAIDSSLAGIEFSEFGWD